MKSSFLIYTAALLLLFSWSAFSQPINNLVGEAVMPAPNAGSLGKYGDIPVSLYTGTPSISIPVYTVTEGSLSLPISLDYHSSGIRVAETASWVGIGWSLQAGGVITRTTQGIEDDYYPYGFYHHGAAGGFLQEYAEGGRDAEPDIFSFNVAGYSGKFFFDADQKVHFVPKGELKLESNLDGGAADQFDQFTLIAPDGTRYYFGKDPDEEGEQDAMEYSVSPGEPFVKPASSWYLVRIESSDKLHNIRLTYGDDIYSYRNLATRRYISATLTSSEEGCFGIMDGLESSGFPDAGNNHHYVKTNVKGKRLLQITSSTETVDFVPSTENRLDLDDHDSFSSNYRKLDAIRIKSGGFRRVFRLEHGYFEDESSGFDEYDFSKRLKLLSVQEVGCEEPQEDCEEPPVDSKPPYVFQYHELVRDGVSYLPHRLSRGTDHWGYFNGADGTNGEVYNNENALINLPPDNSGSSLFQSYREADFDHGRIGTLKKVTYPTGGHTEFLFESNQRLGRVSSGPPVELLVLQEVDCFYNNDYDFETSCCGSYSDDNTVTFSSPQQIQDIYFEIDFSRACTASTTLHKATITAHKLSDMSLVGSYEIFVEHSATDPNKKTGWLAISELAVPGKAFELGVEYKFELVLEGGFGSFKLKEWPTVPGPVSVGGLRIKEIRNDDGKGNKVVKSYSYVDDNGIESGQLFHPVQYSVAYGSPTFCITSVPTGPDVYNEAYIDVIVFSDQPIVPLGSFSGTHVAYSDVREYMADGGFLKHKYHLEVDPESSLKYPSPPDKFNRLNGEVKEVSTNSASATISKTTYLENTNPLVTDIGQTIYKYAPTIRFSSTLSAPLITPYEVETSVYRVAEMEEELDGLVTSTEYEYDYNYTDGNEENDHYFPTTVTVTNSDGKEHSTHTEYAFDLSGDVYEEMVERNMIATPIRTEKKVDDVLVDGTETVYDFFGSSGAPGGSGSDPIYPKVYKRFETTWDENGDIVTGSWETQGEVLEYDMDAGKPKRFQQPGWEEEIFTWNTDNKLISAREYEGFIWSYAYHEGTKLVSDITDIDGQSTSFEYDGLMRLKQALARGGAVTTDYAYNYGSANRVTTTTSFSDDTPSQVTLQYFDGLGRPTRTYLNYVLKNEVKYDNQGRVAQQTFLPGNFTTFDYEPSPLNRIRKEIFPDGSFTETIYGSEGNYSKLTKKDEDGKPTTVLTDKLGRTWKTIDALSGETVNHYDDKSRLIKVVTPMGDDEAYNFLFRYDERDRLVEKKIPGMGGSYAYTYNEKDLLETTTDPNDNLVANEYDIYGRLIVTEHNSTVVLENTYDVGGGINVGKLTESEAHEVGGMASFVTEYGYDSFGRVETTTKNNHLGGSDEVTNEWNDADWLETATRVHSITGASPLTITQGYEYDKFGRVTEASHSVGSLNTILARNSWNNRDQLTSKTLGGGLQRLSYTYNERGWLTSINQPLDRFAETSPMSDCDEPAEENNSEVFCGGDDVTLPVLNSMRFDEDIRIECYDPCALTGGLVQDPPGCNGADPQSDLAAALAAMEAHYTEQVEHLCEDNTTQTSARPVAGTLPYPAKLCRVRLCDGTEAYVFESEIGELTAGSYAILQEIQVTGPTQTFKVNSGTGKGQQEVTLAALLGMVLKGDGTLAVADYVEGVPLHPCEPVTKLCSEAEAALQQASLTAIMQASAFIDFKQAYKYPMELYRVILCDGTETYLFSFELPQLYGPYTILQTITITSVEQTFQVGGTVASVDLKDLFYLGLQYGKPNGLNAQLEAPAQKNGNIAGIKWQVAGREMQAYGFQYDGINRLKQAKYADIASDGVYRLNDRYNERLTYDAIGNILSLERHGVLPDELNPGCFLEDRIDVLAYSYDGNRLTGVADSAPGDFVEKGFRPGGGSGSYGYDDNGNMTTDPYKDLEIDYNYLNLPSFVTPSGIGGSITFSYDATGRKYRKVVVGPGAYTQDYVDGIEYRDGELEAIYNEEGRVAKDEEDNLRYEFTMRDHLGNARVTFSDLNEDGKIQLDDPETAEDNESEILQENHYYPFGMNMDGAWAEQQGERNDYQYNGKEFNDDLGLDWSDYGARWYDASLGRWWSVDPLADKYHSWSPYNYVMNNPVKMIDPDGKSADWFPEYDKETETIKLVAEEGDDEASLAKWSNGALSSEEVSGLYATLEDGKIDLSATFIGGVAEGFKAESTGSKFNCFSTVKSGLSGEDKSSGYGELDEDQFKTFVSESGLSESPATEETVGNLQPFNSAFGYTKKGEAEVLDHVSIYAGKDKNGDSWELSKDGYDGKVEFKKSEFWGNKPDKVYQGKK